MDSGRAIIAGVLTTALIACSSPAAIAAPLDEQLRRQFEETVRPVLQSHCLSCHEGEGAEAQLDLTAYTSTEVVARDHRQWKAVLDRVSAGEMPPGSEPQPTADERKLVIDWIRAFREREMQRNAGDPGVVPARRLSNAEYDYTIHDLTGVDIRPAKEFPVDPANEAGFDNSAESLTMSPALLTKYLGAARTVVEHLVLKPEGFDFAPHPVVTDTDRDKYCVKRIIQFYERQPTDLADYFVAAWKYRWYRERPGVTDADLQSLAETEQVSARYLRAVYEALSDDSETSGPLVTLRTMWHALPDDAALEQQARRQCEAMGDYVLEVRRQLEPQIEDLSAAGIHKGSQTFVLWKNRQYVAYRRSYDRSALVAEEEITGEQAPPHPDLIIPANADRERYEAAVAQFCSLFPDAFYVSERGRDYLGKSRDEQEKGRLLSAGFHSMMGYFRDDAPLYELILSEDEQRELDRLWQELDFITSAPMRQYAGFLWFERTDSRYLRDPEFDFARAEDKAALAEPMIQRLAEVYLEKARREGAGEVEQGAITRYFDDINKQIRRVEADRKAAEPTHLQALLQFAARAYRRDLTEVEREDLLTFYHALRADELSHEEAIQDCVVSVLMSAKFCFRVDLAGDGEGTDPRSDDELANRLSYFLWSSMPDDELRGLAGADQLHREEVLRQQTRRMLQDERIERLATEFGGNWLDFRRFGEHNAVDREQFPQFTDELRQAMFEEPIRFFVDVVQNDRSVLEFLEADHTFVNRHLAEHYGITHIEFAGDEWQRVEGVAVRDRGGLLPMAVFLTHNSPGLRTSPVKRGYWVVRRLLGEEIPPPPPDVPELPQDERGLGELTLAEVLARHRDHASCAGCHDRFDSIGLVFENFGPIGEWRGADLGGRAVSSEATFPDGSSGNGVAGLRKYLREQRQEEFLDNLCRKLLSYALGRTLLLSDEPLIEQMRSDLEQNDHRFGSLIESIVTSRQFLHKRGSDRLAKE
jgi:hypothetical protein